MSAPVERDALRSEDAAMFTALHGHDVTWMGCAQDGVTRNWHATSSDPDGPWQTPQPCFQWPGQAWEVVPFYQRDWNGAGLVIEAMREQHVEVQQRFLWWLNDLCSGPAGSLKPDWVVLHMTPQAVAQAARAALEREVGL